MGNQGLGGNSGRLWKKIEQIYLSQKNQQKTESTKKQSTANHFTTIVNVDSYIIDYFWYIHFPAVLIHKTRLL